MCSHWRSSKKRFEKGNGSFPVRLSNFCLVSCFAERPGFYKVEPYAFRIKCVCIRERETSFTEWTHLNSPAISIFLILQSELSATYRRLTASVSVRCLVANQASCHPKREVVFYVLTLFSLRFEQLLALDNLLALNPKLLLLLCLSCLSAEIITLISIMASLSLLEHLF